MTIYRRYGMGVVLKMTNETVVHVTTLEQWNSVLDVWFSQGYEWFGGNSDYLINAFRNNGRYLFLHDDGTIVYSDNNQGEKFMEYSEFMAQQEKTMTKETYYVTQGQLDLIEELKALPAPLVAIMNKRYGFDKLYNELPLSDNEWLRYLGGDETIEFKVKEQLYRLSRIDDDGDKVWFMLLDESEPDWTLNAPHAFTATEEEITQWKTPAWEIEEVN